MKPINIYDTFDYPREISPNQPWRYHWRDSANNYEVTFDGQSGQKTRITVKAGSHPPESRLTAHATLVRADPPPPDPPPVEPPEPPTDPGWRPSRAQCRYWKGNFLALPDHGYSFMYPGHDPATRAKIRRTMVSEGLTHLPFGIWGAYPGLPSFDFRSDPAGFRAILDEMYADHLIPVVFCHTNALPGERIWTKDETFTFLRNYLPQIRSHLAAVASFGWEFPLYDASSPDDWTADGHNQLELISVIREAAPGVLVYGHWTPERWAGLPDRRGNTEGEGWFWAQAKERGAIGLLYNDNNPEFDAAWYRFAEMSSPHGASGGIVGRMVDNAGLDCVAFELSRGDLDRWREIKRRVERDGRISGYC